MKLGIIGNGFVGSAIIHGFLLTADKIYVYDRNPLLSTHSFEETALQSDVIFVCVPTPMYESGEIDTTIVEGVIERLSSMVKPNQVVVVKSTVVPGTMEKIREKFASVRLVFNPEFLTERQARLDFINSARIVLGGDDIEAVKIVENVYRERFPHTPIILTNFATAQMIKYVSNCFFATKVSFMNEMRQISEAVGADWEQTVKGFVLDGRVGNSHLDVPGHDGDLGFGGKCFPKDINALIRKAEKVGVSPTLLKAAWEKNVELRNVLDWYDIPGAVTKGGVE